MPPSPEPWIAAQFEVLGMLPVVLLAGAVIIAILVYMWLGRRK